MSAHLAVRPIPIAGESPASVLIRAVEHNGYPNLPALVWAYWKRKDAKGWAKASHIDPARYGEILDMFGISVPNIDSVCFRRAGMTSETARLIDGMQVPEAMFRDDARYYCPICIRERAFWRRNWTLRSYSVCPEHQVYLIRDCPVCNGELNASRGRLKKCECGANLTEVPGEHADPSAVNWWLELHQGAPEEARVADALFLALSETEGGGIAPKAEHRRLCAVHQWMESRSVAPWLSEWVEKRAETIHPRILLLPFLRRVEPESTAVAKEILRQWEIKGSTQHFAGDERMLRRDAELALGICSAQFKKFSKQGLLDFPDGGKPKRGQVSLVAVNRLLFSLQAHNTMFDGKGRAPTSSIASMAAAVLSHERGSAGYDMTEGLNTLHLTHQLEAKPADTANADQWLDTKQVAEVLGTYSEAVRFLRIKGWIEFRDRDMRGQKRFIARMSDVEKFNQTYVLGGELASRLSVNPTNLSEKLMAMGVQPVAGPCIDGSLVYLFARRDIKRVDLASVRQIERYPTQTGRKRKEERSHRQGAKAEMSVIEAADELGIRTYDVHLLIRKGILERVCRLSRALFVSTKSVHRFRRKFARTDLIPIEDAAKRLGLLPKSLERLWIKAGVLKVVDLGLWRRVVAEDLEKLENILAEYVTAAEAGRIIGMHRSHLPNLERRGIIKSNKIGLKHGVRLYARVDLEKLKSGLT